MTPRLCSYGHWNGLILHKQCRRPVEFVAETQTFRQLCSHHAAIARDLGWTVGHLEDSRIRPEYEERQTLRLVG
jgi:hypothetical protein